MVASYSESDIIAKDIWPEPMVSAQIQPKFIASAVYLFALLAFPQLDRSSLHSGIDMKYRFNILLLFVYVLLGTACSKQAVYTDESFADDSPFKKRFDGEVASVCESARRSLLGQGFLIENANSSEVKARKAVKRESNPNTFIEMNIVCLPETTGSTLFATGLLSTYALKKSSSSASVGVSALGSISVPIGQSADSLVKVSEETIENKGFYKRFFTAVSNILGEMQAGKPPQKTLVEPAAPEPTPVQTLPATVVQPALFQPAPLTMPEPAPANTSGPLPVQDAAAVVAPEPSLDQTAPAIVTEPAPALIYEAPKTTPEQTPAL